MILFWGLGCGYVAYRNPLKGEGLIERIFGVDAVCVKVLRLSFSWRLNPVGDGIDNVAPVSDRRFLPSSCV